MSYEQVAERIKTLPENYLTSIMGFIDLLQSHDENNYIENRDTDIDRRLSILASLQKFRGRLPKNFNAEKELAQARERKYS